MSITQVNNIIGGQNQEYAIVKTGGKQYIMHVGKKLLIERPKNYEVGSNIDLPEVLFVKKDGQTIIGSSFLANAKVSVLVEEDVKTEKVIVFHKRRRKDSRKKQGHRQKMVLIKVNSIQL